MQTEVDLPWEVSAAQNSSVAEFDLFEQLINRVFVKGFNRPEVLNFTNL